MTPYPSSLPSASTKPQPQPGGTRVPGSGVLNPLFLCESCLGLILLSKCLASSSPIGAIAAAKSDNVDCVISVINPPHALARAALTSPRSLNGMSNPSSLPSASSFNF